MEKTAMDKKPRWEEMLVTGKYYHVKYRYNGKEYEDGGTFQNWEYGNLYFKCDNGDWMIIKPFDIISATTT